jgi:myo-inositol-1(or 4)-monophosphatase
MASSASGAGLGGRYDAGRRIAREAGRVALDYFRNRGKLTVELKGPSDYVTHADRDV